MDSDFKEWVEQTTSFLRKRLTNEADIFATFNDNNGIGTIHIYMCNAPIRTFISFEVMEYKMNNYHQRRKFVKIRRLNIACELEDIANELFKVCKKLRR